MTCERQPADRDLRPDRRRRRGRGRSATVAPRTATRSAAVDRRVGQERALPDVVGAHRGVRGATCRRSRSSSCSSRWRRRPPAVWISGATRGDAVDARRSRSRRRGSASIAVPTPVGLIVRRFVPRLLSCVVMLRGRALADADEGDDRRDADDDAEHRQRRPQRGSPAGATARGGSSSSGAHAADPGRRSRRRACGPGAGGAATSGSWVIRTIVRPAAWSSRKELRGPRGPGALSRLPVGSSARISAGSVTIARATATRCCSPPDSSVGSWSSRSPRPSRSSAAAGARQPLPAADALVQQRRRDVVERRRPRQQVVATGRRTRSSGCGCRASSSSSSSATACRRAGTAGGRPVEAADDVHHRASCPSRTARRSRRTRPGSTAMRDVAQGVDLDAAHLVGPADRSSTQEAHRRGSRRPTDAAAGTADRRRRRSRS